MVSFKPGDIILYSIPDDDFYRIYKVYGTKKNPGCYTLYEKGFPGVFSEPIISVDKNARLATPAEVILYG